MKILRSFQYAAHSLSVAVLKAALLTCGTPAVARAEVDAAALARAVLAAERRNVVPATGFGAMGKDRLSLVAELPRGTDPAAHGLSAVSDGLAVGRVPLERIEGLVQSIPGARVTWAPGRRLLLDRAAIWTGAPAFRTTTGATGRGVLIGIVDTGVDFRHSDLRDAEGRTRVDWLIDFSRPMPDEPSPVERRCGCAVLDAAQIDELIAGSATRRFADDRIGHGTHVASLAAGNGLSSGSPRYVGVAPEARLIVARVTRQSLSVSDADVLLATQLIFELADAADGGRRPAVVNLSLGSDFGPHDESSGLGRRLAALVGDDQPGRAIVVAAGNSAGVLVGEERYPEPLGVHTQVHVPSGSSVRVPVITPLPRSGSNTTRGGVFIWIGMRQGDRVSVGLDRADGPWVAPLPPADSGSFEDGDLVATIVNGAKGAEALLPGESNAAVILLEGRWPAGETFAVRLEGQGTASLWVQSEGDLGPGAGSLGALFPRATKEGTINIPAVHPTLIAVGATVNRTDWIDERGNPVSVRRLGGLDDPPGDSVAFFSSAGPSSTGALKPELVAPGAFVVGAMSASADPIRSPLSIFGSRALCRTDEHCLVVTPTHGVTSGTSMASPIVAGAVALLFERDPALTQQQVRALLQAGARRLRGVVQLSQQVGVGALDLEGTFAAHRAMTSPSSAKPSPGQSWLAVSSSFARPDPQWPVVGRMVLRDEEGRVADGFDVGRLRLSASPGVVREPLTREAPGLWRFQVAAAAGTGGGALSLTVELDGITLVSKRLPIAVDPAVAAEGFSGRGSSCRAAKGSGTASLAWAVAAAALVVGWRRRRQAGRSL